VSTRREAHANQVCKKEKADKFANSKAQKIKLFCFEGKRGDMHIATQVLQERKKLTNLQMANSLFMMGHSMNKILTMADIIM
jgi:hypothetical protein